MKPAVIGGASQNDSRAPPALTNLNNVSCPEKETDSGPRAPLFLRRQLPRPADAGADRDGIVLEDQQAAVDVAVEVAERRFEIGILQHRIGEAGDQGVDPGVVGEQDGDRGGDAVGAAIGDIAHDGIEPGVDRALVPGAGEGVDRGSRAPLRVPVPGPALELFTDDHVPPRPVSVAMRPGAERRKLLRAGPHACSQFD